ncbi:MAG: tRNA (guanosine(46)-N7)-methyltransferase TrmB [Bacteroidetes bacterium]|nr:MAG: tRNA (guanosine(46)-N7)-methyltransferase TrmB [Bacteroidota bacterium]
MSKRNKLQKFADLAAFPNVYENFTHEKPQLLGLQGQKVELKGKWRKAHFKNEQPITLELACGRGEYTLALARRFPQRNFIGVDIKGARIWKGARIALEENLTNAAFLRTRIEQLNYFFAPREVEEIWITFPDPFPKKENRRLTSPPFIDSYRKLLPKGGLIHLKTDATDFYEYTLTTYQNYPGIQLAYANADIYEGEIPMPELAFKTYYEAMHLREGKKIKYLRLVVK